MNHRARWSPRSPSRRRISCSPGELGGDFLVLDARDGSVVFRYHIGSAIGGGIVTYQVAGKQYVAVMSGTATYFWRTPPAPATVTIFAVPAPASPDKI